MGTVFVVLITIFPPLARLVFGAPAVVPVAQLEKWDPVEGLEPASNEQVRSYLVRYGYVQPAMLKMASPSANASSPAAEDDYGDEIVEEEENTFVKSLKAFQRMSNLPVTGKLDDRTRKVISKPRCGVPDVDMRKRRRKRVLIQGDAAFGFWNKKKSTYAILHITPNLTRPIVRQAMEDAFNTWSEVVPLDFQRVEPDKKADIHIIFARGEHRNSDGSRCWSRFDKKEWKYDGTGVEVAHGFPISGEIHFNEEFAWVYHDGPKIKQFHPDIQMVATHEIGHVLGLPHKRQLGSIMYKTGNGYADENGRYILPQLLPDDISDIQAIYGKRVPKQQNDAQSDDYIVDENGEMHRPTKQPPRQQQEKPADSEEELVSAAEGVNILVSGAKERQLLQPPTTMQSPSTVDWRKQRMEYQKAFMAWNARRSQNGD